jgi:hypothetical protein
LVRAILDLVGIPRGLLTEAAGPAACDLFGEAFDTLQRRLGPDYPDQPVDWAAGYSRLLVTCTRVQQDSLTAGGGTQANAHGGARSNPSISQTPGRGTMTRLAKADSSSTRGVSCQAIEALTQDAALVAVTATPRRDTALDEAYRLSHIPGPVGEAAATLFGSSGTVSGNFNEKGEN